MRVQTGPSRSMPGTPVGVPAGSRGVERSETPGRVTHSRAHARDVERKQPHARPRLTFAFRSRRFRCAPPPAILTHPSGVRRPDPRKPGAPEGHPRVAGVSSAARPPGIMAHSRSSNDDAKVNRDIVHRIRFQLRADMPSTRRERIVVDDAPPVALCISSPLQDQNRKP